MKIGLRAKFGFLFLAFGITLLIAIWLTVYSFATIVFINHYTSSVDEIIDLAAYSLGMTLRPEDLHRYAKTGVADEHYNAVLEQMKNIRERSGLAYLYIIYPTADDMAVWVFDASEDGNILGTPVHNYNADASRTVREVYHTGKKNEKFDITETEEGDVVSIYYPIKDESEQTIAVLGGDLPLREITDILVESMIPVSRQIILVTTLGMLSLLLYVQFGLIRSIRRLRQGVEKMADGELGVQVILKRRDEIGEISQVFNRMSSRIQGHIKEMNELNKAYRRFLPPETFEILQKDSVIDIRLGDEAQTPLTVLSMEPSCFREKTRDMSAEEVFRYINGILQYMVPFVLTHGGTIERFERAGVRSFYRKSAAYALRSAISAGTAITEAGEHFCAGIAQGQVMVGIAGHEERMNIISLSDQKKLSEFLMEIAPQYHACILISEGAASEIPAFKDSYHCRFLGYLRLTASGKLQGFYDVFDSDSPKDRRYKQMTRQTFEEGVRFFCEGRYTRARQAFIAVLRQYREDGAAKAYLYRCSDRLQEKENMDNVWIEELK